jgi:putative ATPase
MRPKCNFPEDKRMYKPLADEIRPHSLDDVVGQKHILGQRGLLRRIVESGNVPNMIFYGPSGTGKTTVARIIAEKTNRTLRKLNATTAGLADIKEIISELDTLLTPGGVLLYLDEIQYFNKKQQQSLLEFIEDGRITLIASTTENPYFCVFGAILSRSTVFEFKPVSPAEAEPAVMRAFNILAERDCMTLEPEDGVIERVSMSCGGDVRKAINAVELLYSAGERDGDKIHISLDDARAVTQRSAMRYDRDGDEHFDALSALMKSLRGSDPDAALHYLARLLEAGDLTGACRRILCSASEDIGLAYPQAVSVVKACVDSALQLGLPEARLPLAEAAIFLATAPKSNSVVMSIDAAISDVRAGRSGPPPRELQNVHADGTGFEREQGYKYPHSYPNHWVRQQYLPDALKDARYYEFGDNKIEQTAKKYWDEIKK